MDMRSEDALCVYLQPSRPPGSRRAMDRLKTTPSENPTAQNYSRASSWMVFLHAESGMIGLHRGEWQRQGGLESRLASEKRLHCKPCGWGSEVDEASPRMLGGLVIVADWTVRRGSQCPLAPAMMKPWQADS
mmetsp:Transcript_720/g.2527  ORF Transcript_720/g.2527 Transcript_720/m.2527 type:complete len:132 (-) Transcript_720:1722-2117(-)|eukprot:scaffold191656_cov30-Tisochrysis_lutea.AAC.2